MRPEPPWWPRAPAAPGRPHRWDARRRRQRQGCQEPPGVTAWPTRPRESGPQGAAGLLHSAQPPDEPPPPPVFALEEGASRRPPRLGMSHRGLSPQSSAPRAPRSPRSGCPSTPVPPWWELEAGLRAFGPWTPALLLVPPLPAVPSPLPASPPEGLTGRQSWQRLAACRVRMPQRELSHVGARGGGARPPGAQSQDWGLRDPRTMWPPEGASGFLWGSRW